METVTFQNDIKAMYIQASSFPEGLTAAHRQLHSLVPFSTERKYLGISRPENGTIIYKAAAEELMAGEAEQYNLPVITLKKGRYSSLTIHDYMKEIPAIEKAFKQLLAQPGIDADGYCVEWYINDKDLKCMVKMNN